MEDNFELIRSSGNTFADHCLPDAKLERFTTDRLMTTLDKLAWEVSMCAPAIQVCKGKEVVRLPRFDVGAWQKRRSSAQLEIYA